MVNLLQMYQVVYGYDFGYLNYKSKPYAKLYSFFLNLITTSAMIYHVFKESFSAIHPWVYLYLLRHIVYVLAFIFSRSNPTFYSFECELKDVDNIMKYARPSRFTEKRNALCLLIYVGIKLYILLSICGYSLLCSEVSTDVIILVYLSTGSEIVLIVHTLLFESIHHRLKIFKAQLKDSLCDDLEYFFHLYKTLADITEKIKSAYDHLYIVALIVSLPDKMISIYYFIWASKNVTDKIWWQTVMDITMCLISFLWITIPALCAGNIATQNQKIRIVLCDKILSERDETKRVAIEKLNRYVEARPLKFTMYRVVPLDANLLGLILNFCVTYLIVIIQFTHLF